MLEVTLLTPQQVIFKGSAPRVIFPGEQGIFEVGPFHRPLFSRLLPGTLIVDDQAFSILRGVVKVDRDSVTSIVETPDGS